MKILNSLENLWNYCSFCPICQNNRKIEITVGPDFEGLTIKYFTKEQDYLYLNCQASLYDDRQDSDSYAPSATYNKIFKINLHSNVIENIDEQYVITSEIPIEQFFFFMEGICSKCKSQSTSIDIEFGNVKDKIVAKKIGIEFEFFYIKNLYVIQNDYLRNCSIIYDYIGKNINYTDSSRSNKFPLINFNFSNIDTVITKIKTLLIFQ